MRGRQLEFVYKNTILSIIAPQIMKYITTYVQDLYAENFKSLTKYQYQMEGYPMLTGYRFSFC